MRDPMVPRLAKWPFLLSAAVLMAFATLVFLESRPPRHVSELLACTGCVAVACASAAFPFVLEYFVLTRFHVADRLADVTSQISNLEKLSSQISNATSLWQSAQQSADKTAAAAKEISLGITSELGNFKQFLQNASESEKSALRLEVSKLRRSESEWLQVLVRLLDHVYALHQAGLRSRQPTLIEQLGSFQNACRDAARRVGLSPFVANPDETFDKERHQLAEQDSKTHDGDTIDETVATGYTFQGRLIRPAIVRLRNGSNGENK